MEAGSFKPSEGHTSAKRKLNDHLMLVSPLEWGKGLPYAPVDWPNRGDIWGWRVGSRIRRKGVYQDRYLVAPRSLQERSNKQIRFTSKLSVERFIRSKFPNADINAFFASFTWDIAANTTSRGTGNFASSSQEAKHGSGRADGIYRRTRKTAQGLRRAEATDKFVIELKADPSSKDEQAFVSDTTINVSDNSIFEDGEDAYTLEAPNAGALSSPIGCKFDTQASEAALTAEDFDNYVDALDEILTLPLRRGLVPFKREEMIPAREKLSSLLAVDFPSLISSEELSKLAADCALKLQNEPNLSPQELAMIKLILEIPFIRKCFLEAKETLNEADKFFADLDSKIVLAASLKQKYIKSKEEMGVLQAEEGSMLLAMTETDEQIARLQSYRSSLVQAVEITNKKMIEKASSQKEVMDSLPKVVLEVQAANSMRREWELKKNKSAENETEILAKFAPLKGFSF